MRIKFTTPEGIPLGEAQLRRSEGLKWRVPLGKEHEEVFISMNLVTIVV